MSENEAPVELPDYIHVSGESAKWILDELKDQWDYITHDSVHHTYHLSKAIMELKLGLDMEID